MALLDFLKKMARRHAQERQVGTGPSCPCNRAANDLTGLTRRDRRGNGTSSISPIRHARGNSARLEGSDDHYARCHGVG